MSSSSEVKGAEESHSTDTPFASQISAEQAVDAQNIESHDLNSARSPDINMESQLKPDMDETVGDDSPSRAATVPAQRQQRQVRILEQNLDSPANEGPSISPRNDSLRIKQARGRTDETQTALQASPECVVCTSPAQFMCSYCHETFYCSKECQVSHWTNHVRECRGLQERIAELEANRRNQEEAESGPSADDLRFYMDQVYILTKPVVICIILSIALVKITTTPDNPTTVPSLYNTIQPAGPGSDDGGSSSNDLINGLVQAAIIIGVIVGMTIILVFLFRKGYTRLLFGLFVLILVNLFGYFGWFVWTRIFQTWNVAIDYLTQTFVLWNFTVGGLMCIFWKGPKFAKQGYLVVMSAFMSYSLTGLPEWTTWLLLGLLVVWDLIAVLCPWGPLNLLIQHAHENPRSTAPLQALLYSTMVWEDSMMMSPYDLIPVETEPAVAPKPLKQADSATHLQCYKTYPEDHEAKKLDENGDNRPISLSPVSNTSAGLSSNHSQAPLVNRTSADERSSSETAGNKETAQRPPSPNTPSPQAVDEDEEDEDRSGLKLGLGDFVFYSILMSRASMFDWTTTLACFVAIMAGLVGTIVILAMKRRALPALPISLTFGILFYVITRICVAPLFGDEGLLDITYVGPSSTIENFLYVGNYRGGTIYI